MNKIPVTIYLTLAVLMLAGVMKNNAQAQTQKHVSHDADGSLQEFVKKIVTGDGIAGVHYKRSGNKALLTFELVRAREIVMWAYLLNYDKGAWHIVQKYKYSKSVTPLTSALC